MLATARQKEIGAIATCAVAGGTAAVASQAISDIRRGEVSDVKAYMGADARESIIIGALSGAVFGPLGVAKTVTGRMAMGGITNAFESCIRQGLEGNGFSFKTMALDAGIGALFAGVLDTKLVKSAAGKADNMAPWIGKGNEKIQ